MCVREWDWSETSQTVALFTREHGLIRGLAKGARRPKAPYSGGITVMTLGEVVYYPARSGLATIAEWHLTDPVTPARRALDAFHAGMLMIEAVQLAVTDQDPHPRLFEALVIGLGALGETARVAALRVLWSVLVETGHEPTLETGVPEPPPGARLVGFDPRSGAITRDPGRGGAAWRVRRETLDVLRRLQAGEVIEAGDPGVERAGRLLSACLSRLVDRPVRTSDRVFGPTDVPHLPHARD